MRHGALAAGVFFVSNEILLFEGSGAERTDGYHIRHTSSEKRGGWGGSFLVLRLIVPYAEPYLA